MADTATFSGAMKTDLIGPIRDGMHSGKVLLFGGDSGNPEGFQGITRSAEHINAMGNGWEMPWKAKRTSAAGFRLENDPLPAPGHSEFTKLSEPLRYGYGVFNITGQLLKAAEKNEGAFISAFTSSMEDTVLTSKIDWNRAAYGDGSGTFSGVRITASPGATTVDVDTTIYFRVGEVVDFVSPSGVVGTAAVEVIAVDRANRQITLDSPLTATATAGTDVIVRASRNSTTNKPNNSFNKEIVGLEAIVSDTGAVHGLSPTQYSLWQSYVDNVSGALNDLDIHTALDTVGFETGVDPESSEGFVMVTTRGVRSRYAQTLITLKQFTNAEALHLRGGFKVLDFDGRPIYTDDQCPLGTLYGLSTKDLFWSEASDWEWMEKDGAVLNREEGYDRYSATLFKYAALGTSQRNRHFKLYGITDDVK